MEGVAAPSGRCLRSGHKNSVKGKGAIKHKGAPTIIYHCTDSPFRLAPLATHPLSGGGQEKHGGKGRLTQNLAAPLLAGGRGTASLPQTLPPPACGGRGTTKWWKGVAPAVNCYYLYAAEFPLTFSLLFRRPLWTGNT